MKTLLVSLFLRTMATLPLGAARKLGRYLGGVAWHMSNRMARVTRINIGLALPHLSAAEQDQLGRESLQETFSTIAEGGAVWLWPPKKILARIQRVEGFDILKRRHLEQRGVIVIGPHLGNWELVGLYLNTCGVGQTIQLFQAPRRAELAQLIFRARSRSGAEMVPTDQKGVGKLLSALRAGRVVGILPDQVPPEKSGEFAPFFGVPALTMTLLSRLLQKTGARAVMVYAKRVKTGSGEGFEIIFREPDGDIYAQDLQTSLAGLNRSVEQLVSEFPAQYQWDYKRFKRMPAGRSRPY